MKCYIVIIEDRHADVEVYPFLHSKFALAFAEGYIAGCRCPGDDEWFDDKLTEGMTKDGWIYYAKYSTEGDCVRVVERELQEVDDE